MRPGLEQETLQVIHRISLGVLKLIALGITPTTFLKKLHDLVADLEQEYIAQTQECVALFFQSESSTKASQHVSKLGPKAKGTVYWNTTDFWAQWNGKHWDSNNINWDLCPEAKQKRFGRATLRDDEDVFLRF